MKQKFSPFNFLVGIFTFGAVSFATAQEPDCNQGDDTNNFESGYTINSTSMYSAADDFFVSPGNTLHVKSIPGNSFFASFRSGRFFGFLLL